METTRMRKNLLVAIAAGVMAMGMLGCEMIGDLAQVTLMSPAEREFAKEQPDYAKRVTGLADAKGQMSQWIGPPPYSKMDWKQYGELKEKISTLKDSFRKSYNETADLSAKKKSEPGNSEVGKSYDESLARLKTAYDESTGPLDEAMKVIREGNENRMEFPDQPARSEAFPRR